jgi:hypothetical protein
VIQHEMDHLNGVLILDRTTRDERNRALRELRDAERARAGAGELAGRAPLRGAHGSIKGRAPSGER